MVVGGFYCCQCGGCVFNTETCPECAHPKCEGCPNFEYDEAFGRPYHCCQCNICIPGGWGCGSCDHEFCPYCRTLSTDIPVFIPPPQGWVGTLFLSPAVPQAQDQGQAGAQPPAQVQVQANLVVQAQAAALLAQARSRSRGETPAPVRIGNMEVILGNPTLAQAQALQEQAQAMARDQDPAPLQVGFRGFRVTLSPPPAGQAFPNCPVCGNPIDETYGLRNDTHGACQAALGMALLRLTSAQAPAPPPSPASPPQE